ncbi:accessory gene regulator ArgB-like protein [Pelotomaculum propionicicum]|uniref:Accessory gene regulator protein B n=1 Tax=Pelotomaculum propionicicum TaxID=258475 RepID=A0A4Y7RKR4_9FIRM|nr:accessory gene regulator B family protein [Pelotomaculum propionicicum]NLI14489.1 accessory gene regulator B family protein [Peptococcaceae bacterium]TEB09272.1 Accessory gene regulator protein B [Pelotomaculum propionicicum]
MSLYSTSSKIATYIIKEAELGSGRTDSVRYGLEIILGAIIKGVVLLASAYFLGILPQVIIALTCGSLLRLVSGGAHCTSYLRCLSCGLVIYLCTGEIAKYLEKLLSLDLLPAVLLPCYLIMALCTCLWAPAEVPYRTINYEERIPFRTLTMVLLTVLLTAAFLSIGHIRLSFIMAGILALLAQTLSFTPLGYKIIGKIDKLLFYITERRHIEQC